MLHVYRSPPEVLKVCVEPEILIFAVLQSFILGFCCSVSSCHMHEDIIDQVPHKGFLQSARKLGMQRVGTVSTA